MPKGVSLTCGSTVATAAYIFLSMLNMYRMMNPLYGIDLDTAFPPDSTPYVSNLWAKSNDNHGDDQTTMGMKVYMSHLQQFNINFLSADDSDGGSSEAVLLWNVPSMPSLFSSQSENEKDDDDLLSKTFVITTKQHLDENNGTCSANTNKYTFSTEEDDTSASFFIRGYNAIKRVLSGESSKEDESDGKNATIVSVDAKSRIWKSLMSNRTVHIHVLVTHGNKGASSSSASSVEEKQRELQRLSRSHSLLLGQVPLVKHDEPLPRKPTRVLIKDVWYLFQKHISRTIDATAPPPWTKEGAVKKHVEEYGTYNQALTDKQNSVAYPYWKPEVAVKLVPDTTVYPIQMAANSGYKVVDLGATRQGQKNYAYLPPLDVDEIGLTSEKYIPLNETVNELPLKISLDTLSAQRYRLIQHFSHSLDSQRDLGFEESDIDDVRRLISDTNVTLLAVTCLASVLHLLFEFLTFKSEVEFWKSNKDLTGLSVRALFSDLACQSVILLYLIDKESSLLMIVPQGIGILIAAWKCHKAAGFKLVKRKGGFGWTIQATRLKARDTKKVQNDKVAADTGNAKNNTNPKKATEDNADRVEEKPKKDLDMLTVEMDRKATRTLGVILLPFVIIFALRSLVTEEHSGWYSWFITSASGSVYALGFVLMTPQLFLNYKLKSVAHLPWRVLCYKFLNTFIDDLFAFIIRMPTMARISCFRDDVVFVIYLFQRYVYEVDESRPVEGVNKE